MTRARAAILIPAYNEAAVIGGVLRRLTRDMEPGEFDIVVIANACADDTARIARAAAPMATVLETPTPGKTNAMRLGLARASAPVTVFLDADLEVDAEAIRRLIAPLERGEALASHGRMDVDLEGCSPVVRAFYAAWAQNPYLKRGKFGGLFALSAAGVARVQPLPDLIADDEFISRRFSGAERAFVGEVSFVARAPRDLGSLFRVRRRSLRGTRQVERLGLVAERPTGAGGGGAALKALALRPRFWPAAVVYVAMMLAVRVALALEPAGAAPRWERDHSTRQAT